MNWNAIIGAEKTCKEFGSAITLEGHHGLKQALEDLIGMLIETIAPASIFLATLSPVKMVMGPAQILGGVNLVYYLWLVLTGFPQTVDWTLIKNSNVLVYILNQWIRQKWQYIGWKKW